MTDSNTGRFVWYDLITADTKAAQAFYSEVIGWKTQPFEGSEYMMWAASQGPLGGVTPLSDAAQKKGVPSHWMANVLVADVDKTVARVRELGGSVRVEPSDMQDVGRFAVIADPQGAEVSIFKPSGGLAPHDVSRHGEICWNELLTSDKDSALRFYQDIFGWQKLAEHDMGPMGTYLLYGQNGTQYGGMFNNPNAGSMPPAFLFYVQVDDLDAALARATRYGAKVLHGPMEVPGGARVVQLADPQGAAFALHTPPKS